MIHHLAIVVADLQRAERFWVDVVRLPVARRWNDVEGRHRATWLTLGGGAFLALERASADEPRRAEDAPGYHCLALRIGRDERTAFRERLTAAGHPVVRETPHTLYVRDPDGNLVGFSHWPDATTAAT